MSKQMPIILISLIVMVIFLDPFLPLELKQLFYSISLTLKSLIIGGLPFIIFGLLFKSTFLLISHSKYLIGFILAGVCASNFLATFLSQFFGRWIYQMDWAMHGAPSPQALTPLWMPPTLEFFSNQNALLAGVVMGLFMTRFAPLAGNRLIQKMEPVINTFLQAITLVIPLFILGFIIEIQYKGVLSLLLKDYLLIFLLIGAVQTLYILLLYIIASRFDAKKLYELLTAMLPAALSGMTTMSSAATLPLTLAGTEKHAKNKEVVRFLIPATANIHLLGDCFAIPLFAYAILKTYGLAEPGMLSYLGFTFYFVLYKFSVVAVPGGGVLVMLPLLKQYFGFNAEMVSLMTMLYMLFDPLSTCMNILGNGAFAKLFDEWLDQRKKIPVRPPVQ